MLVDLLHQLLLKGLFLFKAVSISPRRMNLSLKTTRFLMIILMNFLLVERYGWDQQLLSFFAKRAQIVY